MKKVVYKFLLTITENFSAEKARWPIWTPVLFGIGIGIYFLLPIELPLWMTLVFFELLIMCGIICRRSVSGVSIVSVLFIIFFGFVNVQMQAHYQQKQHISAPDGNVYVTGRILKIDKNSKGKERLVIDKAKDFDGKNLGRVRITLRERQNDFIEGRCIELVAKLMPFFTAAYPNGYQFDRRAFFDGLSSNGYALSRVFPVECTEEKNLKEDLNYQIQKIRNQIVQYIFQILPKDEAGIATAVIVGKKGLSQPEIVQNYRDSGLAHFLSVSGLHMSMITALAFFFLRLMLAFIPSVSIRFDSKKIAAGFALFISFIYLLLSGAEIPAQRAFIMTFVVLLGVLFSRRAVSMYMLALAAMIVLIFSPQALTGPSFQMSFAAVTCLVAFYEKYSHKLQSFLMGKNLQTGFLSRIPRIIFAYFAGIIVSDLVASLATLPYAVYHFNRMALYTTLTNFLAGPIIGFVIMPFVLCSLFLMPFGLAAPVLKTAGWGIHLINQITEYTAALPHASPFVPSMPIGGLLAITFGGLWLCIWECPWRKWGLWGIFAGILSLLLVQNPDFIISRSGKLAAFKNNAGYMVLSPGRQESFNRKVWMEKTASPDLTDDESKHFKEIYQGEVVDEAWLNLHCDFEKCTYKERINYYKDGRVEIDGFFIDSEQTNGAVIFLKPHRADIRTVRENIGRRLWNEL